MTQKSRLALFMVGATLANILLTFALFFALLALYSATLGQVLKAQSAGFAILACIILAFVGSTFIYNRALAALRKRPDLADKFGLIKR